MLVALRQTGVVPTQFASAPSAVLRGVVLALVVVGAMIVHGVRARIPPPRSGDATETWWVGEGRRAFVLWSVAEAVGLTGAVAYLVTGDVLILVVPMVWGVLSMVVNTPRRLTGT